MPRHSPLADHFWGRVAIGGLFDCWPWLGRVGTGGTSRTAGYGRVDCVIDGIHVGQAHRVAFLLAKGPIAEGLTIDHLCANRLCCNPAHLEAVTVAENIRRARWRHGRCPRGHDVTQSGSVFVDARTGFRRCAACHNARSRAYRRGLRLAS